MPCLNCSVRISRRHSEKSITERNTRFKIRTRIPSIPRTNRTPIIEDLEVSLVALREELHVRAENSGSVVGPLVFGDDGDRVDCAKLGKGRVFGAFDC